MNLKALFNPWRRIAELERELSQSDAAGYEQYKIAQRLHKENTALKAAQQPRDPVTGRMRAKVR